MRKSRAEPDCLEYTFSADPIDPDRVVLFERWASRETLGSHLAALRADPELPRGEVIPT
jgi:quinol monooxygenase YgiN